ncbi:MAG: glycosyltransferase [Aquabacterium sp.]|uniref:glycosyltransferase n=1 Tax=Aquabacterium sp. TaxID=1872578 RepID=UPI003BB0A719
MPTTPDISIAIPAHNEERYIGRCIESVFLSAQRAQVNAEVVVALNRCTDSTQAIAESLGARCVDEERKCIAAVRNAAVRGGTAKALATLDADSWMQPHTMAALIRHVHDDRYVGGGATIWPERWSAGIVTTGFMVLPYVIGKGISAGMFWCQRDAFEAIGGFDERLISVEDVDFAVRLRVLGKARGQRFGTLWRGGIITSCRKFDHFGDWYLVRNPGLIRRIFTGHDRKAADLYYYDVER